MKLLLLTAIVSLSTVLVADPEVFDVGELSQYAKKEGNPPNIGDNSVWISGSEEHGGFDLGLSQDIKAKVEGVLEGCGQVDDKCYQDARAVFRGARLEVDRKLDRRGFVEFVTKTVRNRFDIFLEIYGALWLSWKFKQIDQQGVDSFIYVPASKAGQAAPLRTAPSVVISADRTAIATITPKPDPTTITGSQTPSVTAVTSAHDGLNVGEIVVSLDQDLAGKMQEIMVRSTDCEDGAKFDREHPPARKRAGNRLGRAICAYQAVIINMGTTLSDLAQTDLGVLDLVTPNTTPEQAAAAEYTEELIREYAPTMNLPMERARALAAYLFAVSIGVVLENQTLGTNNKIPASLIKTSDSNKPSQITSSPSSSSSSRCPDPTQTPLFCGFTEQEINNCNVKLPKKENEEPKCADGEHTDCPCSPPVLMYEEETTPEQLEALKRFAELFKTIKVPEAPPAPEPPKAPTRALAIIADHMDFPKSLEDRFTWEHIYWNYFTTDYGRAVGCREDPALVDAKAFDPSRKGLWFPGGETPLKLYDQDCVYRNSGDNAGKLFCGDKSIDCFWDPANVDPAKHEDRKPEHYKCKDNWTRQAVFTCPF